MTEDLAGDDELDAEQLAAMDSLWRALRQGSISAAKAQEIETVIRRGHVHGARKRLTEARRESSSVPE